MKYLTLLTIIVCVLGAQAKPYRTPRIINSQPSPNVGYHAFVGYMTDDFGGYFGGGTIISDRHVLTSGKNIEGYYQWDVGFGSNVYFELTFIKSYDAILHPEFNYYTSANDIGIITLPQPLVFTSNVFSVALPDFNTQQMNQLPFKNEEGAIVGFGYTTPAANGRSVLLMGSFQRVTNDTVCDQFYENALPHRFCATDNVDRSNACIGDVGIGFVSFVRGRLTVTGIASYIRDVCSNWYPTGYTRVEYYREWIRNATQL